MQWLEEQGRVGQAQCAAAPRAPDGECSLQIGGRWAAQSLGRGWAASRGRGRCLVRGWSLLPQVLESPGGLAKRGMTWQRLEGP